MNRLLATAVVLSAVGFGCSTPGTNLVVTTGVGSSGDQSGSGGASGQTSGAGASTGAAKAFFVATVYPDLATMPNSASDPRKCGDCHAPPGNLGAPIYLGSDAESSYNVITNTPNFISGPMNSALVINGSVAHTGPGMNAQQLMDVSQWLRMEVMERGLGGMGAAGSGSGMGDGSGMGSGSGTGGGGGLPPGTTVTQALTMYGQCMDYAMWLNPPGSSIGLDQLPTQQTQDGPCEGCHEAGLFGNWLSDNPQETFAENQVMPYVTRQVSGQLDGNGNFEKLVGADRWINKGSEPCDESTGQMCHPQFTLPPNMVQAIQSFVNYTIGQVTAGTCNQGGTGGGGGAGP